MKRFRAKLKAMGRTGAWVCLILPFRAEKEFGSKGRVSVKGAINGFPFRSSIFPTGNGQHRMMVNKTMLAGAEARPGETVGVEMEADTGPRPVPLPPDLQKALAGKPALMKSFKALSYTHRKDFVTWVHEAKRPETRAERVRRTVEMLKKGITLGQLQKQRCQRNRAARR
jgi:hypothetical protein